MELAICCGYYRIICRCIGNCTLTFCRKPKINIGVTINCGIFHACHLQLRSFFRHRDLNVIRCRRMIRPLCHADGNRCRSGIFHRHSAIFIHGQYIRITACIGQCPVTSVPVYGKCKFRIAVGLVPDGSNRYLSGCLTYRQCTFHKTDLIICTCQSTGHDGISSCVTVGILRCICFSVITGKCQCSVKHPCGILRFPIDKSIINDTVGRSLISIGNALIFGCDCQCFLIHSNTYTIRCLIIIIILR